MSDFGHHMAYTRGDRRLNRSKRSSRRSSRQSPRVYTTGNRRRDDRSDSRRDDRTVYTPYNAMRVASVQLLTVNECTSNPCRHGATCVDQYNGFLCQCAAGWQGPRCDTDVNECSTLAGTDLGCQNGATCVNTQGSFQSVLCLSCSIIITMVH